MERDGAADRLARIHAVTAKEVQRVVGTVSDRGRRTVGNLIPSYPSHRNRHCGSAETVIATLFRSIVFHTHPLAPARLSRSRRCSHPLSAAEIVPTKFVTSNGMTVLALSSISCRLSKSMRWSRAARHMIPEKAGLANLVASLLDEGDPRPSKQLAEQIDFVGGALEVKAAEDFTTASVRVLKKDVELGFIRWPTSRSTRRFTSPSSNGYAPRYSGNGQ